MNSILLIDDSTFMRSSYKKILKDTGFQFLEAENGLEALELLLKNTNKVYAIILDEEMPIMNGYEFLCQIKKIDSLKNIPIIYVSSVDEKTLIENSLRLGVYDYLIKPINPKIMLLKLKNAINLFAKEKELQNLNREISEKNIQLNILLDEKIKEIEILLISLTKILENASFYNDNDTGYHVQRVAAFAEIIARNYGLPETLVKEIKTFAPIHDIGKIGISDDILKKPKKLNFEEFETIKTHTIIGYNMIENSPLPMIAKNIVLYHHEKWNGKGYPFGMAGGKIPIEARILAISDVFDALINKRVYKNPFSREEIIEILEKEKNESFEEELVNIVLNNLDELYKIKNNFD